MPESAQKSVLNIDQFIRQVGRVKSAEEAHTEAGSIGGETEHPVKNVDDRTEPAKEGERSKENSKDVKEDQGAPSVEETPEATAKAAALRFAKGLKKKADGDNPFIEKVEKDLKKDEKKDGKDDKEEKEAALRKKGALKKKGEGGPVSSEGSAADDSEESELNPQPTGKTPDIETSSAKAGKEDPGSDHPARTDNDSLDGHKYAGDDGIYKIARDFGNMANDLCAQIAWLSEDAGNPKQAAEANRQSGRATTPPAKKATDQRDPRVQMQAAWEMAGLENGTLDKQAADRMVYNAMLETVKVAADDATNVITYLDSYFAGLQQAQKQAAGEGPPPVDPSVMAGGGAPGPDGMASPAGPPPDMGGAGGGGGGGPDEGGMMAALGGGHPADGGPMGGGMGGGGGSGDDAQRLADMLEQLGVTPEELQQAMQQEGGGGGGEGDEPPAMGGPGGDMGGGAGGGMEHAGSDRRGKPVGKQKGSLKQGAYYNAMRDHITEIIQRSRQGRAS